MIINNILKFLGMPGYTSVKEILNEARLTLNVYWLQNILGLNSVATEDEIMEKLSVMNGSH